MKEILRKLADGRNLTDSEARDAATEIMEGRATEAEMASFLTALRMKGETAEEIASIASVMREKCSRVRAPRGTIDLCGTGGAPVKTFNVSTISSFVVASAGIPVAKHGNRSFTSRSGSADLLEKLGANINIEPKTAEKMLSQCGITFLFAPEYHPATKNVAAVRRALSFRTVFNLIGPLTNPAGVSRQVLGVFSDQYQEKLATALMLLGSERAMVVHGGIGLDEISPRGRTAVMEVRNGVIEKYEIEGSDYSRFGTGIWEPVAVADSAGSADFAARVLDNRAGEGERSIVLLNSAAGLYVSGKCGSIEQGMERALESIESGRALAKLREFISLSREATGGAGNG
ncbi:MAG: anthranilate phosphoribosyltransferase [Candidatus Thermoplasmatota archaeon]|jgi:anthranilate phosphoribosyltransferase|nr:anthranilate phosphoribosyltransferase [Candidatus Sysuiplasma jiujiangense]MBX8641104.1 anthranilate phosphoribosyltransferase [Candidatus Sysuiplasma jiujiangense]MCL4317936.1 anthranilate phosphoribosyltransferase [Candidatus Thermoplasmatota archaeon]MCL5253190.1 anthranilate phosphoribosyltransferase [Candidatus Thermoplasmatota archaeon]